MSVVSMKQLLEAGVHFGHQTRRWNPKMKRFIFDERNGIYIIDLQKTMQQIDSVYNYVRELGREGGKILFVGTKKQAKDSIQEEAERCNMPFVSHRWLGGMLTNFSTISLRVNYLKDLHKRKEEGYFEKLPKKEVIRLEKKQAKLYRVLCGLMDMPKLPIAVFVVDPKKEHIAVKEARKLGIPVIGIVDTNCDPDLIDWPIPANDDAIKAVRLISSVIADAILEGRSIAKDEADEVAAAAEKAKEAKEAKDAAPEEPQVLETSVEDEASTKVEVPFLQPEAEETLTENEVIDTKHDDVVVAGQSS